MCVQATDLDLNVIWGSGGVMLYITPERGKNGFTQHTKAQEVVI